MALGSLLAQQATAEPTAPIRNPLAPKSPHFPARATNVIYLFMAGGPSQLELFDYKPRLTELNGQPIPDSYVAGKRFAFMDSSRSYPTVMCNVFISRHVSISLSRSKPQKTQCN